MYSISKTLSKKEQSWEAWISTVIPPVCLSCPVEKTVGQDCHSKKKRLSFKPTKCFRPDLVIHTHPCNKAQ